MLGVCMEEGNALLRMWNTIISLIAVFLRFLITFGYLRINNVLNRRSERNELQLITRDSSRELSQRFVGAEREAILAAVNNVLLYLLVCSYWLSHWPSSPAVVGGRENQSALVFSSRLSDVELALMQQIQWEIQLIGIALVHAAENISTTVLDEMLLRLLGGYTPHAHATENISFASNGMMTIISSTSSALLVEVLSSTGDVVAVYNVDYLARESMFGWLPSLPSVDYPFTLYSSPSLPANPWIESHTDSSEEDKPETWVVKKTLYAKGPDELLTVYTHYIPELEKLTAALEHVCEQEEDETKKATLDTYLSKLKNITLQDCDSREIQDDPEKLHKDINDLRKSLLDLFNKNLGAKDDLQKTLFNLLTIFTCMVPYNDVNKDKHYMSNFTLGSLAKEEPDTLCFLSSGHLVETNNLYKWIKECRQYVNFITRVPFSLLECKVIQEQFKGCDLSELSVPEEELLALPDLEEVPDLEPVPDLEEGGSISMESLMLLFLIYRSISIPPADFSLSNRGPSALLSGISEAPNEEAARTSEASQNRYSLFSTDHLWHEIREVTDEEERAQAQHVFDQRCGLTVLNQR